MHIYMCTHIHKHINACVYIYVYMYIYSLPTYHMCTCIHIHIYTYMYIYTHTHIHTHIYIYIYICMCIHPIVYVSSPPLSIHPAIHHCLPEGSLEVGSQTGERLLLEWLATPRPRLRCSPCQGRGSLGPVSVRISILESNVYMCMCMYI